MRTASIAARLRLAAVHALAGTAAASTLVACGGAVDGSLFGDSDAGVTADGAKSADAVAPVDGAVPSDGSLPFDASKPDGAQADAGACILPAPPPPVCGSATSPCLPDGWAVGQNNTPACASFCSGGQGGGFGSCYVAQNPSGTYQITCQCAVGRFPAGLTVGDVDDGADPVGAFFARAAALEASAVRAFEQLSREVAAHGAPEGLVRRLRRAAKQEIRHARLMTAEAKRRGAKVPRVRATRAPRHARSLFALALENAVEGCGREAIGGALLHVQATRATDARMRDVLAEIADDECGHAELSADLAAWLAPRLCSDERATIAAARRAFFETCADSPPTQDAQVARALGFPDAHAWRRLTAAVEVAMRDAA